MVKEKEMNYDLDADMKKMIVRDVVSLLMDELRHKIVQTEGYFSPERALFDAREFLAKNITIDVVVHAKIPSIRELITMQNKKV